MTDQNSLAGDRGGVVKRPAPMAALNEWATDLVVQPTPKPIRAMGGPAMDRGGGGYERRRVVALLSPLVWAMPGVRVQYAEEEGQNELPQDRNRHRVVVDHHLR